MRVLLVDHDSEGLETIARAIRGVLELDCVTSKGDALLLLRQNAYDVLIACERAEDGSGHGCLLPFFHQYPDFICLIDGQRQLSVRPRLSTRACAA
jgi:hypothetical protein